MNVFLKYIFLLPLITGNARAQTLTLAELITVDAYSFTDAKNLLTAKEFKFKGASCPNDSVQMTYSFMAGQSKTDSTQYMSYVSLYKTYKTQKAHYDNIAYETRDSISYKVIKADLVKQGYTRSVKKSKLTGKYWYENKLHIVQLFELRDGDRAVYGVLVNRKRK
jgi:hypothetical protein